MNDVRHALEYYNTAKMRESDLLGELRVVRRDLDNTEKIAIKYLIEEGSIEFLKIDWRRLRLFLRRS